MPPPGGVRIRVDEDGISLLASAAPRRDLLVMLSREIGFDLLASDVDNDPVTVRSSRAPLAEVVSRLLGGDRAFGIAYRGDPLRGRHVVARLEVAPREPVGDGRSRPEATPRPLETPPPPEEPPALADGSAASDEPLPAEGPGESRTVDWKLLLLRLDDADADERIAALEEIDPDGEGLTLITDRLARDPDARVRVVAAEQLEMSDTLAAVDALVLALEDPDRSVVLAAIEALEFTDDVTVVADLGPLLQHPDPEIREAAEEAIEFIREDDED